MPHKSSSSCDLANQHWRLLLLFAVLFAICLTVPYLGVASSPPQLLTHTHFVQSSWSKKPPVDRLKKHKPRQSWNHNTAEAGKNCDLSEGRWAYDSRGPLYANNSCPILTSAQNCQGNGRPDSDYQLWRWKPTSCQVLQSVCCVHKLIRSMNQVDRFNASAFLELLHGKVVAFVGDSVSRNQMESLVCILMQVETPMNKGNKQVTKWFFPRNSVTIMRVWSSWLIQETSKEFKDIPADASKLEVTHIDPHIVAHLPTMNILVISSGHWYTKKTAFIDNGHLLATQGWFKKGIPTGIDNHSVFYLSMTTVLQTLARIPNYKGLTVLRTYSPDHYQGGTWNLGGTCSKHKTPLKNILHNRYTDAMHRMQIQAFHVASNNISNGSRMRLLDITKAAGYRADGHPGPYRTKDNPRSTDTVPQDCLHWCMPGPIDTWNELLFEILKQEL